MGYICLTSLHPAITLLHCRIPTCSTRSSTDQLYVLVVQRSNLGCYHIGYICLSSLHCVFSNVQMFSNVVQRSNLGWNIFTFFYFSPLCVFKCPNVQMFSNVVQKGQSWVLSHWLHFFTSLHCVFKMCKCFQMLYRGTILVGTFLNDSSQTGQNWINDLSAEQGKGIM